MSWARHKPIQNDIETFNYDNILIEDQRLKRDMDSELTEKCLKSN